MPRAERETRKRSARCPECGKYFSPQGMNGHLRFTHKQGIETMQKTKSRSVISGGIAARARHAAALVEQLQSIRAKKAELGGGGWFDEADDAMDDARAALEQSERELRGELRKLAGKAPLAADDDDLLAGDDDDDDDDLLTDDAESGADKKASKKPGKKAKSDEDEFWS